LDFDHLDDGQFEELTYDLMESLDFKNVNWRRGTGKGGATADQGRDVVGDLVQTSVDGSVHTERWFVQCKHYKAGVPPQKLNDALAWASAERPAVLLIAVSNFLSNPAKSFLEQYETNNRPAFRIKIWERKDFERLLAPRPGLLRKFELHPQDPFIDAHLAHTHFLMTPTSNTLQQLFGLLESLSPDSRDLFTGYSRFSIINPRMREATSDDDVLSDLIVDKTDYRSFRKKCFELRRHLSEYFLVRSIVNDSLTHLWHLCNPQLSEGRKESNERAVEYFKQRFNEVTDVADQAAIKGCMSMAQQAIDESDKRQQSNYRLYTEFCELIVLRMFLDQHEPDLPPLPSERLIPDNDN